MEKSKRDSLPNIKREVIKVAKELNYGEEVIESLRNAKTVNELSRIMATARNKGRKS